ncbi:unnamed protein product [Adineta ricciae]|uniref:Uncharacterized protein n=1 Tax=Adineta ricciae TaxID=249248 RepID=A0A816EQD6_ADIRI|nr:unnamed protein product [Adineta ricciae]CAF1652617.1 unnamed protein product [Adineta ricciae]
MSLKSSILIIFLQIVTVECLTTSCQKNRFIDYSQLIKTRCTIENCILSSNCTTRYECECKRDYVVRYNVTIEHEDDEDDQHDDEDEEAMSVHLGVISRSPNDKSHPTIFIGESYPCFYDERDITTVFWSRPNRRTYYILLTLSLILVFTIILVPIIYLLLIIKFTNSETKKDKKTNEKLVL